MAAVRIVVAPDAPGSIVAGGLAAMNAAPRECPLTLAQVPARQAVLAVQRHEADLAVLCRSEPGASLRPTGLVERVLLCERLMLTLAADHPAAGLRRAQLGSCVDEPWVLRPPGSLIHALSRLACRSAGFEPAAAYVADDTELALGLVAAGLGVALLPASALAGWDDAVVALPVDHAPLRVTVALWRARDGSDALRAMVACLACQSVGQDAAGPEDSHARTALGGRT